MTKRSEVNRDAELNAAQKAWSVETVGVIADAIKYFRLARQPKLSTQGLADACKQLGFPSLTRSVVTAIEIKSRESVSVQEVRVLAEALEIPVDLLIYPLGRADKIEVLPGRYMTPYEALEWAQSRGQAGGWHDTVGLFRTHAEYLRLWHEASEQARRAQDAVAGRPSNLIRGMDASGAFITSPQEVDPEVVQHELALANRRMEVAEQGLVRVRRSMIGLDLTPPELPEALNLDEQDEQR